MILSLMGCKQSPATLLEWSSQLHIINYDNTRFVYGLSLIMHFNDMDRQLVEESFEVYNTERDLKWLIDADKTRRNSDNTLSLEVMLFANDYRDLLGDIEVHWRSLYGVTGLESIAPHIQNIPNPQNIPWDEVLWETSDNFENMQYAYDEASNIGLLMITMN